MNIWRELDWQAIGTWFTGAALVTIAWLTWKIQREQHRLLYSGPRINIDYSEAIVDHSNEQRNFWIHVQLVNPTGIANSVVECNWDITVPQKMSPSVRLVLPSQNNSRLEQIQVPSNINKNQLLIIPFRVDAFDTIDGWLYRCVSDSALNSQAPERVSLIFIDSTGRQYKVDVKSFLPVACNTNTNNHEE